MLRFGVSVIVIYFICMYMYMQARRPDTMLGVVSAALCIGEEAFRKRFADYQALLERLGVHIHCIAA